MSNVRGGVGSLIAARYSSAPQEGKKQNTESLKILKIVTIESLVTKVRHNMRIDSFQSSQNIGDSQKVKPKAQQKAPQTVSKTAGEDQVVLSSSDSKLQQRAAAAPDVRQGRVDAVKQAVDAGTFNVSNTQLANSLFKQFFKPGSQV
jgi:flagellar biosynthesis anti-sigma factor FlgM